MIGRRAALAGSMALAVRRASAACEADVAVAVQRPAGLAAVAVALDGKPATMLIDTGAERSTLTLEAVRRLGLALDPWVGSRMRGAGGRIEEHQNASLTSLRLGARLLSQHGQLSLAVSPSLHPPGADGLLGGDLMGGFDLDFDLARGTLAVLDPACPALGVVVPLTVVRRSAMLARLWLDGRELTALIDTGASITLLNRRGMVRMGLSPEILARDPVTESMAIGGVFAPRRHVFRELRLGPLTLVQPELFVIDVPEPAHDLIIGLDVLERRRIRISIPTRRLVFPA